MKSAILCADGRALDDSLAWRVLTGIFYTSCVALMGSLQL